MRIFVIEDTCVSDEFNLFKKPIRQLAYAPNGEILVTCCEDGSVSIHNARRQHLPVKMMKIDFPPEFVHVAFSPIVRSTGLKILRRNTHHVNAYQNIHLDDDESEGEGEGEDRSLQSPGAENFNASNSAADLLHTTVMHSESLFAIMGDHGNNVCVHDTESIILRNKIHTGHILRQFQFSQNT